MVNKILQDQGAQPSLPSPTTSEITVQSGGKGKAKKNSLSGRTLVATPETTFREKVSPSPGFYQVTAKLSAKDEEGGEGARSVWHNQIMMEASLVQARKK